MIVIIDILKSVVDLFLDDEFLAIAVLVIVALASILSFAFGPQSVAAGGFLFLGCVAVLVGSVLRTACRPR